MKIIHPRPNPIVAAMYTLRDLDVDVIVVHGPSGCCFMASRMLEEAGVRVVTSGMKDSDLIFGGAESLTETLRLVKEKFDPDTVAVIGTCASMIIGEDMEACILEANIGCNVFPVMSHGCIGDNTEGAVKALEAANKAKIISTEEMNRQINLMRSATQMEKAVGMASKEYLSPTRGKTKIGVCKRIIDAFSSGKRVACIMLAKKELAFRYADMFIALKETRDKLGGELYMIGDLDPKLGLPRIRGYATSILSELKEHGVEIEILGGSDEYALLGQRYKERVDEIKPNLLIIMGIPHAYPELSKDNILITDQPRQMANYLSMGFESSVCEASSHSLVMGAKSIVNLETADVLRELVADYQQQD